MLLGLTVRLVAAMVLVVVLQMDLVGLRDLLLVELIVVELVEMDSPWITHQLVEASS